MQPKATLLITACALTILPVGAATVIQPTGATSTTQIDSGRNISRTIDGSGLNNVSDPSSVLDDSHTDAYTSGIFWLSSSTAMGGSTTSATEMLTFNLGATYNIDTIYLWAYNRAEKNRGIRTFNISFSSDGSTFTSPVAAATLGMSDFDQGLSNGVSYVQTRSITKQTGVSHVRFTGLTTHGSTTYVALSEIRFGDSIPEPSTALLSCLGMLPLLRRRR